MPSGVGRMHPKTCERQTEAASKVQTRAQSQTKLAVTLKLIRILCTWVRIVRRSYMSYYPLFSPKSGPNVKIYQDIISVYLLHIMLYRSMYYDLHHLVIDRFRNFLTLASCDTADKRGKELKNSYRAECLTRTVAAVSVGR